MNTCLVCQNAVLEISTGLPLCTPCFNIMCKDFTFAQVEAQLIRATENPLELINYAGHVCYQHLPEDDTHTKQVDFFKMLVARGHNSVIEHVVFTFDCICDRGVSHELVRHRLASYSQESTRYCNYKKKKLQYIMPSGLSPEDQVQLLHFLAICSATYLEMITKGIKPQTARAVLPNCLKTQIIVTMNLRELRWFFGLRTHPTAHPEMQTLATAMRNCILGRWPEFVV